MYSAMTDSLAILAAATEPCPARDCPERYPKRFEDTRPVCETCGGTGKVSPGD